jgi:hypothetical protein
VAGALPAPGAAAAGEAAGGFFGLYVLVCAGAVLFQGARSGSMAVACLTAGRRLHDQMLHAVLFPSCTALAS